MDYAYEQWVMDNYVRTNPRFQAISQRMEDCYVRIGASESKIILDRYFKMKEGLLKIYGNDLNVKKRWKTLQAVKRLSETNSI